MIDNIWVDDWFSSVYENEHPGLDLLAYPNPFNESLSLKPPNQNRSIESVRIFDIYGKLIKEEAANSHEITLDLSDLKAGLFIYFAIDNVGEKYQGRVIKY